MSGKEGERVFDLDVAVAGALIFLCMTGLNVFQTIFLAIYAGTSHMKQPCDSHYFQVLTPLIPFLGFLS